ncbi:MAG: hypothetical protein ACYC3X_27590 [Pirellulaceae bacterium]
MIGHRTLRLLARSRHGLTAVELLVAATLAAMLMVSVLGLVTTLHVHCRELIQDSYAQPWGQLLADELRRDLSNARHMAVASDRIVLTGYLGTAGVGHHSMLRAAEVTYLLAVVGDTRCLLRDELPLDVPSNTLSSRQLVATGIASFQFTLPGASRSDGEFSGGLPESCYIRFFDSSSVRPLVEVAWCQ